MRKLTIADLLVAAIKQTGVKRAYTDRVSQRVEAVTWKATCSRSAAFIASWRSAWNRPRDLGCGS